MTKRNNGYYYQTTYSIIKEEFEKSPHDALLTKTKIKKLVCEKKNIDHPPENPSAAYTPRQVQPSVHRSINALLESKKIMLINNKYYAPYSVDAFRMNMQSALEKLPFNEKGIFFVSPSTILLSINGVSEESSEKAAKKEDESSDSQEKKKYVPNNKEIVRLFKEYLTEENCFDVHIVKNYVVLLVKGSDAELSAIGKELSNIANRSWELQNQPKMNFRKRRRPKKKTEKNQNDK